MRPAQAAMCCVTKERRLSKFNVTAERSSPRHRANVGNITRSVNHQGKSSTLWSLIDADDWCLPRVVTDLPAGKVEPVSIRTKPARARIGIAFAAVERCLNRLVCTLVMESLLPRVLHVCDPMGPRTARHQAGPLLR